MQFLPISHRREGLTETQSSLLVEVEVEVQRTRVLYSEGVIRQVWHRADVPGACLLWEGLQTLPFAKEEIVKPSLVSLKPL